MIEYVAQFLIKNQIKMKRLVILVLLLVGSIVDSGAADKVTLVSTSWTCYKTGKNGKVSNVGKEQTGNAEFIFDNGTFTITVDGKSSDYDIIRTRKSNNTYVGTKIYCSDDLYVNVYMSKADHTAELLVSRGNTVIIFDISNL